MANIRDLASVLGSAARANKYRVTFAWPAGVTGKTSISDVDVLAKTATAPTKEVGMIELWEQGRKLVIPGDTVFDNSWPVDFYLTEDHQFRYDMITWMDACDNFQTNMHSGNPVAVMADLRLEQLDSAGNVTAQYTMHNCFPQSIGEVAYGADSADTPAEVSIIFAYTDWVTGIGEASIPESNNATKNDIA